MGRIRIVSALMPCYSCILVLGSPPRWRMWDLEGESMRLAAGGLESKPGDIFRDL